MNSKFSMLMVMLGSLMGIIMRDQGFSYLVIIPAAVVAGLALTWVCRHFGIGMKQSKPVQKTKGE